MVNIEVIQGLVNWHFSIILLEHRLLEVKKCAVYGSLIAQPSEKQWNRLSLETIVKIGNV